ncbi:MAG TPA: response regulator [Polyangiaceae bacterium]
MAAAVNVPAESARSVSTNLLLVDDHPQNLAALTAVLEPLGQNLRLATSGKEALRHVLTDDFAAILLDVQMPGMDGFETATLIKGRQRSHHIPILFLTAFSKDKIHVERGYGVGAVDYISKPFDPDVLRSKVAVFVELFQKNAQIQRQSSERYAKREREVAKFERASKERYQALAESMPQIVWTATGDGTLTYGNPRWYACAGISESNGKGLDWKNVLHPEDLSRLLREWRTAIAADSPLEGEYRFGNANAGYRWHLVRAVAERDARRRVTSFTGTSTDIDDRKHAEQALRLQQSKLEDANRAKDEFLAMASHELRTPLNAMLGWTRILRTGRLDEVKIQRALETIERNAQAQAQLITDLLEVSSMVAGNINVEFSELELRPIVEGAVEAAYPVAEAAKVTLVVKMDDTVGRVRGDALRLQQVVGNLLSNALNFTPAGGRVEVELVRDGEQAVLRIADSGLGIEPDFLPHVFERFRQADNTMTRSRKGLGLGLAIVRHLVGLHDGTVTASSDGKDKGSTFLVTLPLLTSVATPDGAAVADRISESFPLTDLHVLVVDDDDDGRELLRTLLEERGARVSTAVAAGPALLLIQSEKPDVLISDIGLPGEDGHALMRRVRALTPELGGTIPAIALTAYASLSDRNRAIEAGFQAHFAKPFDQGKLSATVVRLSSPGIREGRNGAAVGATDSRPEATAR